jgi:multidrug efflux pump subunit AcrA (membrane-fusion protein)
VGWTRDDAVTRARLFRATLALAVALPVAACDMLGIGYTPIKEIVAAPARFDGQEVEVTGVVTSSTKVPLVEIKAYVLRADGAELTVTTLGTLPPVDEKVSVQGKVKSAAIVGGRSIGLHLVERKRL